MGGGGGFFRGTKQPKPESVAKQIENSVEETKKKEYEIELKEFFARLLAKINDRDADQIQEKIREIEDAIQSEIKGSVTLRFGGSVAKHTYVDGLSDVDSLVFLNDTELSNKTPDEIKEYFYNKISEAFPHQNVEKGNLAVTVKFRKGTEIQLLPAVKFKTGYKIPSNNNKWSDLIKPDSFAKLLRGANIKTKGKMLPVIKLAKAIISTLPKSLQLSGYHTEAISIQAFYNYDGEKKIRPMLKHFFEQASSIVKSNIKDKTGQSVHVDDYLGSNNSLQRKIISNKLDQIKRQMKNADLMNYTGYWKNIFS